MATEKHISAGERQKSKTKKDPLGSFLESALIELLPSALYHPCNTNHNYHEPEQLRSGAVVISAEHEQEYPKWDCENRADYFHHINILDDTLFTSNSLLPLVDEFRTLNWLAIKRDLDFSMFSMAFAIQELQN